MSQEQVIEDPGYEFADPCPPSMRQVKISDLSCVDINWRMLTLQRPDNKIEEEIFSKLVQLDKLRLATRQAELETLEAGGGKDPDIVVKNASESKGGVIEKYIRVCSECADDFCYGGCITYQYDSFQRNNRTNEDEKDKAADKKKKKGRKKRRQQSRNPKAR